MDEMKIYIGHSTEMQYEEELYSPLKESEIIEEHELMLPHDSKEFFESKSFLREECDLLIAEVSNSSIGLGIELGWADEFEVPVVCVYKESSDPSDALKAVTEKTFEYSDRDELVEIVKNVVEEE